VVNESTANTDRFTYQQLRTTTTKNNNMCVFGSAVYRIDSDIIDFERIDSDRIDSDRINLCLNVKMQN